MVQLLSKVLIIDNSGGRVGTCIKILNPKGKKIANIGDLILVSIKKNIPNSKVKRGGIYKALIVRSNKGLKSRHTYTKWFSNSIILVKKALSKKKFDFTPIGTRIKGPISMRLKKMTGCLRIHYLAKSTL